MKVFVTLKADDGERAAITAMFPDAVFADDGHRGAGCDTMLSLWPRRELQRHDLSWDDLAGIRSLKVITAGVNHIGWSDVPASVEVHSTPAATGHIIAEYVLGAVIAWARGFQRSTADIRTGRFHVGQPMRAVNELRIGVIGFGGLGQGAARLLLERGASVRAVSRSGRAVSGLHVPVATMDGLADMVTWSDVLIVALPLTVETAGLVDGKLLDAFESGLLINIARGLIVDEEALHAWLSQRPDDRHAHMDVWWQYPRNGHPFSQPFHELDNVTMTPHNSPNVTGFRDVMLGRALEDLVSGARHQEDPELYRMPRDGDGR